MLQTKAIYNLLRLNREESPSSEVGSWALEDLRILPQDELFSRLKGQGLQIDKTTFLMFADESDTPEELSDLLIPEEVEEEKRDPIYLLIFELWRRLLPEKQSLSIFCDELDHRIALYDQEALESDELIQDGLANLLEVLDENADAGTAPDQVFTAICDYCAHDIESFIYDYISDLLDSGNSLYASELVEGFSPYVTEPLWFDFLRVRLLSFTDVEDANRAMGRLLEHEHELPLLMEMIRFLSVNGERPLFVQALEQALSLVQENEEWVDLAHLIADYYRRLDEDDRESAVQKAISNKNSPAVLPADLQVLKDLLPLSL